MRKPSTTPTDRRQVLRAEQPYRTWLSSLRILGSARSGRQRQTVGFPLRMPRSLRARGDLAGFEHQQIDVDVDAAGDAQRGAVGGGGPPSDAVLGDRSGDHEDVL